MKRAVTIALLIVMSVAGAFAQAVAGLGAVSGSVRDATGAVVPGATVIITNESKGITRTVQTTDAGVFSAPALTPSSGYAITVNKDGFSKWEAKNFEILVGQTVDFSVGLKVGGTAVQVDVTGEAPLVQTTKTDVSQVVEKDQIENLPINGRRADTFVLLTPAVTDDGTYGLVSFRGTAGGNSFLTDGNDTTQSYYGENAGRTRITTQISQDAVQEFQVLSNGFSAEFGRAQGGVINTVTKSGGNQFHGTAYEYFRNRTLNAKDRYAPATLNPPEWRHQAGASIGGPIKRDKLFYFANTEFVKRNFPGVNRILVNGFTDGNQIIASCTATAAQCAAAKAFIEKQMNVLVPRTVSSVMGFAKLDWRPTERNSFNVQLNAMHWRSPHGIQTQAVLPTGNMLGDNGHSTVETRYGKASWTAIPTNTTVNEFRFGWFKDRLSDPGASDLFPAETGPLYLSVQGATVGASRGYPRTLPSENRFQFVDNFSWMKGAHSFKFGVDTATTQDYIDQIYNRYGAYSYSSFSNFAKDFTGNTTGAKNYSNFTQAFGTAIQNMRTSDIAFYAQDVWKAGRKLTVNYGIRYEHTWIPQPSVTNPDYPKETGRIPSPTKNFSPRLGVAYSLNDKTVLRAGYGIFWARFHGNGLNTLLLGNGVFQPSIYVQKTDLGAPVYPYVFSSATGLPAGTVDLKWASEDFHNPYTQQGTIGIERQLGRDMGLTLSYIWTRGIGIWVQRDMNLAPPTSSYTYTIKDANDVTVGSYTTPLYTAKVNKNYGRILQVENGGQSWYNGLAVQFKKRFSAQFGAEVAYTWSHAIDDADMQGASWNVGWNYNNALVPGDWKQDRGSSTMDQRHRLVVNWRYSPKFTNSTSALARYLVNGWELSTITTLASAHPRSATVRFNGAPTGIYLANTSLNGSGGWNRVPFWPVNSLDVDTYHRVDGRLSRSLPFSERVKGSLIFEGFNIFNTITNTGITTEAFSTSGGVITPTKYLGVGNQSEGFPDGTNARRLQVAFRLAF